MSEQFLNYLEKTLPPSKDPKYKGFFEYASQSIERGKKIATLINAYIPLQDKKILDVGCGEGGVAIAFAKAGCQMTAIDNYPNSIAMARLRIKEEGVNFVIKEQSAEKLDFEKNSFDGAILIDFLEYTLKPDLVLKHLNRVIKPGGFCYIAVLNRLYWFNKTIRHPNHKRFYFYNELRGLLKQNGFNPNFLDSNPWRRPFKSYWKILAFK